jgi:hypothetical protein
MALARGQNNSSPPLVKAAAPRVKQNQFSILALVFQASRVNLHPESAF